MPKKETRNFDLFPFAMANDDKFKECLGKEETQSMEMMGIQDYLTL